MVSEMLVASPAPLNKAILTLFETPGQFGFAKPWLTSPAKEQEFGKTEKKLI